MRAAAVMLLAASLVAAGGVGATPSKTAGATPTKTAAAKAEPAKSEAPLTAEDIEQRLAKRMTAAAAHPDLKDSKLSITVRDAETGALIFEREGEAPLAPASNMKLVSSGAAIELLGPERHLV